MAQGCARIDSRLDTAKYAQTVTSTWTTPIRSSLWGTKGVSTRPGPEADQAAHKTRDCQLRHDPMTLVLSRVSRLVVAMIRTIAQHAALKALIRARFVSA